MPKKESESHNKHRTEQKLCTRAKDNLSKKRKRVYIVEEEIVSRFLIKMHPLCRQRCCFPLLLLKCQKRSVLFFSSMCSQETDCSLSLSLSLSLSYSSSSTISPALTLAVIFINIIITVTTSVVSRTSMISTAVIIIIILDYNRIFFRYMCVFVLVILFFLRGSECCFGSEDESEEEEKKITNLLTSWKHVTESNLFDICRAVDGRTICI